MAVASGESAVIVPVPETEVAVGGFRAELDPSARWGVPAHVTVIYPFLSPDRLDRDALRLLGDAVRSVPAFSVAFRHVRWFDEDAVWLAPEPDDGFHALINAVWTAFPGCPPYRGAFADVVPHLTIGAHGDPGRVCAATDLVAARLPITASIRVTHVFTGSDAPDAWRSIAVLPLAAPA